MNGVPEFEEPAHDRLPTLDAAAVHGGRLWTPWRMRYVAGADREEGCIFCRRLAERDDVQSLILQRGESAFVMMNLFPYNTGHLMIVPNEHVASPEVADAATMSEMAALRGPVLRALRRALSPDGFNLGLNVGATAGAGITDHLHEHVVPRWQGDANFMPILAATMVMPELIPVTYAKLRAELDRELGGGNQVTSLVLSDDRQYAITDDSGALPRVTAADDEPIWRSALRDARERGAIDPELLDWAGERHTGSGRTALLLRANLPGHKAIASGSRLVSLDELRARPGTDSVHEFLQDWDGADVG